RLRYRSGRVSGLCLGHGHRSHRHAEIWHLGSAAAVRGRRALPVALRLQAARHTDPCRRAELVRVTADSLSARKLELPPPLAPTLTLPCKRGREQSDLARKPPK